MSTTQVCHVYWLCDCRSDPTLQRKDKALSAETGEKRHATTTSDPHTQAPAATSVPEYRMIDVPPSDTVQRKDKASSAEAGEMHHATTSSEPYKQAPAGNVTQHRMIDEPPSDYLATPLAIDKVKGHPLFTIFVVSIVGTYCIAT